jgi:hypothetical protein
MSSSPNRKKNHSLEVKVNGEDANELGNFGRHLHMHIRECISLADKKAAFVMTISSALLAILYKNDFHENLKNMENENIFLGILVFLAIALLLGGMIAAGIVVIPRLKKSHQGFIFFKTISTFPDAEKYSTTVSNATSAKLNREVLRNCYDLSNVCSRKYTLLFYAMWSSGFGVILSVALLLFWVPVK